MSKISTAARLLREPGRFLDALISRMYWSRVFTTLAFGYCDRRDAQALVGPDPIPPASLRFIVYGTVDPERFRQSKNWSMQAIETTLGRLGKTQPDGSFHTPEYVRRVWSEFFEVRDYIPSDQLGIHQDMAALVKAVS